MDGSDQSKPVVSFEDYLVERAKRLVARASHGQSHNFFDDWDIAGFSTETITSHPGSGKTKTGTEIANSLWRERKLPTLYLMLSHTAIEERLARLKADGEAEGWGHWRGHEAGCRRDWFNDAGYIGHGSCSCKRGQFAANGPTLAPIEYALPSLPDDGSSLLDEAREFFLWIIDEVDLRRLLDRRTVSLDDVQRVAETHPDEAVRTLCTVLSELMGVMKPGGRLNGASLYSPLVGLLESRGVTYRQLANAQLPSAPWLHDRAEPLPQNFPPVLVPVLLDEVRARRAGGRFNPRIHLVRAASGPELRVWWRKDLYYSDTWGPPGHESGPPPPPAFILDATADAGLLGMVFRISEKRDFGTPAWPDNVHVHQWVDDLVSRSTLGLRYKQTAFSPSSIKTRQRWYGRIAEALGDLPREWPVGIITHLTIENEARGAVEAAGFSDVRSLHYGDDRGSNKLEDVRALVLLGLPIPDIEDFQEEAQAFLHDCGPLEFTWEDGGQYLEMRGGPLVAVKVGGYWKEPVASYYRQKCQSGLYQALHRIRPYIPKDYKRHIFVFTNMPVPGVKVDRLLGETAERYQRAVAILNEHMVNQGECTVPELARALTDDSASERSVTTWIRRNAAGLAAASGTRYEAGKGGRPGRFATRA
jgi:hypothetical protein